MVDLPAPMSEGSEPERFSEAPVIELGQWYWVKGEEGGLQRYEKDATEWLGCVMEIGSNYVYFESPADGKHRSTSTARVHMNDFYKECRREMDPEGLIRSRITFHSGKVKGLLAEIRDITSKLGLSPVTGIEVAGEARALSVVGATNVNMKSYEKSLIKAKEKLLPDLFKEVEHENEMIAGWLGAQLKPFEAQVERMDGCVKTIEERIFHVKLYAGLIEDVVKICDGAPASIDEKVHLLQGRLYMDEECLMDYDAGGMDFGSIEKFDAWVARPNNRASILPRPRCVVAFRVRRREKERDTDDDISFGACLRLIQEKENDKRTFLYIRNGEQLFRLTTEADLRSTLFPDVAEFDFTKPMVTNAGHHKKKAGDIGFLTVSDWEEQKEHQRQRQKEQDALHRKWMKENPKESEIFSPHRHSFSGYFGRDLEDYKPFDHSNVFYDEAKNSVEEDMKYYNRVILILQGLFDRSPVFAPHYPAQLWSAEQFNRVVTLVYDRDRALYAGEKPDFDAFRAQCNRSIKPGSVVIGMQAAWRRAEKAKEEKAGGPKYDRNGHKIQRYSYYCDPGPGFLSVVSSVKGTKVTCEYTRHRERAEKTGSKYYRETIRGRDQGDPMQEFFTADVSVLFNASAYTPGDYKMFLADPRTRAEYIKWAPFLLGSEDFVAGKRKAEKDRRQHK